MFINIAYPVLDEDTDEVLLGLLARDAEPSPVHDRPHRRWVAPPMHDDEGIFLEVKPGWWRLESQEEKRQKREERRRQDEAARKEWEAFQERSHRYFHPDPAPPPPPVAPPRNPVPDWLARRLLLYGIDPRLVSLPDRYATK